VFVDELVEVGVDVRVGVLHELLHRVHRVHVIGAGT
jgi:hypothetical protein